MEPRWWGHFQGDRLPPSLPVVLKLEPASGSPAGLVPTWTADSVSDSVGLGWGPTICVSNKFQGTADTAGRTPLL